MTLKGSGRAASFAISQAGTYKVKVTNSLTATATAHGGAFGGSSVDMSCSVRRGSRAPSRRCPSFADRCHHQLTSFQISGSRAASSAPTSRKIVTARLRCAIDSSS